MHAGYDIEIANLQNEVKIPEKMLYAIVHHVLSEENILRAEVSIALVSEEEIKILNEEFRGIPEPTDVLSFIYDPLPEVSGEIVLAPSYIKRQAEENNTGFEQELSMLLIHGLLHLLGYDHEKNNEEAELMWQKQENLLKSFWSQYSTF